MSRVKGFGDYKNFSSDNWLTEHIKLEFFFEESRVEALVAALRERALGGVPGAGIAAVMPVGAFEHLRSGAGAVPNPDTSR